MELLTLDWSFRSESFFIRLYSSCLSFFTSPIYKESLIDSVDFRGYFSSMTTPTSDILIPFEGIASL
jgi:hypothetical protein